MHRQQQQQGQFSPAALNTMSMPMAPPPPGPMIPQQLLQQQQQQQHMKRQAVATTAPIPESSKVSFEL